MKRIDDIERLLNDTAVPSLADEPFLASLKDDLVQQMQRKEEQMENRRSLLASRKARAAAVIVAALLLGVSAWGARLVYGTYKQYLQERKRRASRIEPATTQVVKIRNSKGEVTREIEVQHPPSSVWVYDSHPDGMKELREKMRKEHEIRKAAIANKTYRFIEEVFPPNSPKQYAYEFTSPDGDKLLKNVYFRLEEIASYEQFLERMSMFQVEDQRQRQKEIDRLVAQKKGSFLKIREIEVHICKEPAAGAKLEVRREERNGKLIARILPFGANPYKEGFTSYEMDWQDHLQAVEDGLLELIEKQVKTFYIYEITLSDGSTHHYAGAAPPGLVTATSRRANTAN